MVYSFAKLDYRLFHLDEKLDELVIDVDFRYDVHGFITQSLVIYDSEESSRDVEVVVKFTSRRYDAQAHGLLAEQGLAPALHACRKVLGDLYMIVVGYISRGPAWSLIKSRTRRT